VALLSFAGGPTEEARLTMVRIVRGDPDNQEVLEINVKNFLKNGQVNEIPVLKPGDTVVVSGSMFHAFSKLVSFIAKIAVVISTYELLFN
jgi:thiamine monophosphate kinase